MVSQPMSETTKELTINGYSTPEYADAIRAFMAAVDLTNDYDATHVSESTNVAVKLVDNDGEVLVEDSPFFTRTKERIAEAMENDELDLGENVEVTVEHVEETVHDHDGSDAGYAVRDALLEKLPDEHDGLSLSRYQYQRDGECVLQISGRSVRGRKVLAHQADRTPDARFEIDANNDDALELPSVQLSLRVGPADEAEVDARSEWITERATKHLSGYAAIGKVRVADCKKTTEGDCFSV